MKRLRSAINQWPVIIYDGLMVVFCWLLAYHLLWVPAFADHPISNLWVVLLQVGMLIVFNAYAEPVQTFTLRDSYTISRILYTVVLAVVVIIVATVAARTEYVPWSVVLLQAALLFTLLVLGRLLYRWRKISVWLLILAIPVWFGWIIVEEYRVEAFTEFAINHQQICNQTSDCSIDTELPWTIAKVREDSRKESFSIRHEMIFGYKVVGFDGGVNRDLSYIVGDEDFGCKVTAKYVDGMWVTVDKYVHRGCRPSTAFQPSL